MSKEKRRVPKLRFPGFTEDWEQCKLSDITEVIMGQSPSSKNYTDNPNDDILVQGNADLKDGKVVPRLWTKEITKTIDKGGIILTVRAPVGDVAKTDYKVVLGRGVAGIKGNDYIYQFLQKLQYNRYWVSLSSGSTFESINSNDIKDLIIDIPSIEEQTKISMLLNNVNSIITLHQRKLDNLKLKKKALLQKLFPKNGERYPELRFSGFTDAWEQRKLGEFVKIVSGDAPSTFISGNCIYVKVDDLNYSDRIQLSSSNLVNANPKAHLVNQGATIFPKRGVAIMTNKVRIMGKDGYLDTNMMALIPEEIDKDFLFTFIQKTGLYKIADTSTIPQINNKHIEPYMIQVPSEKEQAYIGVIFKKIDKIITLHQRKLDHLKLQKKALLQQMFV